MRWRRRTRTRQRSSSATRRTRSVVIARPIARARLIRSPRSGTASSVAQSGIVKAMIAARLDGVAGLRVHRPEAGMFALIDVRATGMSGEDFALALLEAKKVAVMPGESFGEGLGGWLRVSLTQPDEMVAAACARIAEFAAARQEALA